MRKSVYTLFLAFFAIVTLFLGSFGANVSFAQSQMEANAFRIIRQADASGKIGLSYVFPVNSAFLKQEGFKENEIKTFRFYLSTYVNALALQNRDKAVQGVSVGGVTYFEDVDGLGFSIVFEDANAQRRFFGNNNGEEEDKEQNPSSTSKVSGFFIKKLQMSVAFPISKAGAEDLKTLCNMAINSWAKDNTVDAAKSAKVSAQLEDALYIYDYATTNADLKSDVMYTDENFYHNVFAKTAEQLESQPNITFFTTYANTPVWYGAALFATLLGMGIAYIILKRKKKA